MPDRMPEVMADRMPIERQNLCWLEWQSVSQIVFQIEYQNLCPNILQIDARGLLLHCGI